MAGRKVIFDHHDLFPETVEVKLGPSLGARAARICQRLTFAVANHVISTNASYAEVAHRPRRQAAAGRHDRPQRPAGRVDRSA